MDEGLLYVGSAFALIWGVVGGYLLHMARRERASRDALGERVSASTERRESE